MKKTFPVCILLVLSILLSAMVLPAFASDSADSCHGLQAQKALETRKKLDTAKAVILYELNSETMVYSYNADQQVNPTGLVKVLTVLIALEKGNLDDVVKVKQTTLNTVAMGAVSAKLKAGEELTLQDLLHCIMVSSANDACAVVAAHLGGDQAGFVAMMNEKAAELGCTASNFTNAHGLNDPEQYSTPRDLAIITAAALQNSQFVEMFGLTSYTVEATNKSDVRNLRTTNNMMRKASANYDSRVTGGKPAAATTKDRSMICTAQIGDANYLCVVMNTKGTVSEDGLVVVRYGIFEEVTSLLDYAQKTFELRQILDANQPLYQYGVSGGQNDVLLRPSADLYVVLPKDCDPSQLRFEKLVDADSLQAPIAAGADLGDLAIRYGNLLMGSCDLLAMTNVPGSGTVIHDAHRFDVSDGDDFPLWSKLLAYAAFILLGLLLLVFVISLIVRGVRNGKIRKQQRRRARDRKRSR